MNEIAFVDKRQADWNRLIFLTDDAESGVAAMAAPTFHEFVRLYRRVSRDLAIVRTESVSPELVAYLNDLTGRAYGVLYRTPRKRFQRAIGDAVLLSAQTVRRRKWFVLASVGIFLCAVFGTILMLRANPGAMDDMVGAQERQNFEAWKAGNLPERDATASIAAAGFYAGHNPVVSVVAGAIAASTFGVGTVELLWRQGVELGELIVYVAPAHRVGPMLTWLAPHGVTELSGMFISGGAGLCLGWALIFPGRKRRSDALRAAGKDGIVLLATSVVMMYIAAPIEGFFSFNPAIPNWAKLAFASLAAAAWAGFWIGYRAREAQL